MNRLIATGRVRLHWGHAIAMVYAAFAAATVGFVVFAMSQPVDLVSADYYARSLQQDDRRAAVERANALTPAIVCEISADRDALLVRLPRSASAGAAGTLTLYRPSNGGADRTMTVAPAEGGQWVPLSGLARGRWTLQIDWRVNGVHYYHERDLNLR